MVVYAKDRQVRKHGLKNKNIRVLKKLAIAFAIALTAAVIYTNLLAPHTLEAKQRAQLESTQRQLIDTRQQLEKQSVSSQEDQVKQIQQINELNQKLKDTQEQLQARREGNTAVAEVYSLPAEKAKAFIYMHESGNNPHAINASSGACGLGQALPCSKLPCSLDDYACQDNWFTNYAVQRYGSWEAAYNFWVAHNWW